jgi:3-hydroxyacyl-CoA dehydrogenase
MSRVSATLNKFLFMNYEEKLQNVSVLGAGGKMGSGILLLTAVEMADLMLLPENKNKNFIINAIDASSSSLSGLYSYLKVQLKKIAEKKVIQLRRLYKANSNLIENSEIIDQYTDDVMKLVLFTTSLEVSYESDIIFEAIVEDPDIKIKTLSEIAEHNRRNPWFLTNTSSIPISKLDTEAELGGNIIGFHFYNPPVVQKLVELITEKNTNNDLIEFSRMFAGRLNKKIVPSNDFAGFIGNGHFMRDLLFGIQMAERISAEMSFVESVYSVNRITRDFLIRPMGIFQLMDYVGVDVCQKILKVMKLGLNDKSLHSSLIDKLMTLGIRGGQNSDGSQKPGVLLYENGRPVAVFNPDKKDYDSIESFKKSIDSKLGKLPSSFRPWKEVIREKQRDEFLKMYFREMRDMNTFGSKLAIEYYLNSGKIGIDLVKSGVADSEDNVNTVLLTGFFHAYGPINRFIDPDVI